MGDGTMDSPYDVHLEDPPGSGRRACDGEEFVPESLRRGHYRLCPGCRIRALG